MKHATKKLELTGQRFGKLTALSPAKNIGNKTTWLCRCDCGRETVVKTHHLRSGHTKSCGCQNGPGGPRTALGLTYIDGTCIEMLRTEQQHQRGSGRRLAGTKAALAGKHLLQGNPPLSRQLFAF